MNILVTGGAGFVGRNLIASLVTTDPGATIWVVDDLSTGLPPLQWPELDIIEAGPEEAAPGVTGAFRPSCGGPLIQFVHVDILGVLLAELESVPPVMPDSLPSFSRVYHLASVVGGRAKIEGDPLAVGIDLSIDAAFFLWAAKVGRPGRILYASSSAAYPVGLQGERSSVALSESMIDLNAGVSSPDFTYGWSKLTGEYLGQIAAAQYDLKVAVVRPFSGYGEFQEPVYPVPAIALRAADHRDPLYVWGTGEQTRDFVHIEDCVRAMELAIAEIEDGSAINIGSGTPTSFLRLAALLGDVAGYSPTVLGRAGKPVGVSERYCDPSHARERVGFEPRISLREGTARVMEVARRRLAEGVEVPQ